MTARVAGSCRERHQRKKPVLETGTFLISDQLDCTQIVVVCQWIPLVRINLKLTSISAIVLGTRKS